MLNFSSRALLALFIFVCVTSAYGQTKVVVIPLFGDGTTQNGARMLYCEWPL